jgi:hypothetical protein
MHRYEQVDQPSNKAVTLTFGTNGGRDRGEVTGPTKIVLGQLVVVRTPQPGSLTPTTLPFHRASRWRRDRDRAGHLA